MTEKETILQVHANKIIQEPGTKPQVICKGCGEPWPCDAIRKLRQEKAK